MEKTNNKDLMRIALFGWKNFLFEAVIFILLFFIGAKMNSLLFALVYLLLITQSRKFVKGFHLDKRWKCGTATLTVHILSFITAIIFMKNDYVTEILLAVIFAAIYIIVDNILSRMKSQKS